MDSNIHLDKPDIGILITAGTDLNIEDSYTGWTPLMNASYCGDTEIVELLIEAGADQNIKNDNGRTALYYACLEETAKPLRQAVAKE